MWTSSVEPQRNKIHSTAVVSRKGGIPGDSRESGVGAVQPGEEKAPGRPYCSLPVPEGAYNKAGEGLFTRPCSDWTKANGFKLEGGRLNIRKKFFTPRVVRPWHRLPREAVDVPSPLWKGSRPGWMGLWATWSSGRCPCPWHGEVELGDL